jgi:hypothetical protein
MKTLPIFALATLLLAGLPGQLAAQRNSPVEIKDINTELVTTPEFSFSRSDDKRSEPEEWLEVEVEFENEADLLEELTMRVHVVLRQMVGGGANRYFTGEVTYVNVFKGRDKFGIMYIAPNSLKLVNEGKMISANDIEEVGVELLVRGQMMAQGNMNQDGRGPWWLQMQPLQGHLLNKNEAIPFAPLYWSRYEQIKTAD